MPRERDPAFFVLFTYAGASDSLVFTVSPDRFRVRRLRPVSAIEYFMRIDACLFITF